MKVFGFLRDSSWDKMDAVSYYRTYRPLRELHNRDNGIEAQCAGRDALDGASDEELGGRDIYTMCRMYHPDYQAFIDEIHRRGGKLVLDSDDDLTETYRLVSGDGKLFREILGAVDYVTCSTPPLAELFGQYTQHPPFVLKNHVDVDWMRTTAGAGRRLVNGLTIGFSGSPTHWGDWYLPAVPFASIGSDFPDVTLVVHGDPPSYMKYVEGYGQVLRLGPVPFSVYPVLLKQIDILLCAVNVADEFNKGKSGVKPLEAMALGIVPICSPSYAYLDLYRQGAPVVIIDDNTRQGWYDAIAHLIETPDLRAKLSKAGPDWVRKHRDISVGCKQWEDAYRAVVD